MDHIHIPNINNNKEVQLELTPIQEFYSDTNIFITGSTGFLGKILVEKLLRSCPNINTIYILVRNKKGKNLHARVDEIFDDIIFDRLKSVYPKFRYKVVGIHGDCSLPDLGVSPEEKKTLIQEVNVVFHVAATVRFDEKLKMAVAINVRAPQDMLRLAQQMPNLKSLIHVSTAFSNCTEAVIEERIYPSTIDYNKLILMTENLSDKILDNITPMVLDKYPNTYAFTKQVAEDVVRQEGHGLPVGILRPSIVVSTYKEPIIAWINNLYGATGIAAGAGVGLLRTLHCNPDCNANIVPVDMCVNSLIASAWDVANSFKEAKEKKVDYEIQTYNFESSNDQPINWKTFMAKSRDYGLTTPSAKAVWYYTLSLQTYYPLYLLQVFFLHTIPALIVDGALLCIGKAPRMMKIYSKIHKFCSVLTYFSTRQWIYHSRNVQALVKKMSKRDREIFFSDLKQLDWDEFFHHYLRGVRVYLLQDPMDTLPEARKRWTRLYWTHQFTKAVVAFLLIRILWSLIAWILY